jgi:hypothetical protein
MYFRNRRNGVERSEIDKFGQRFAIKFLFIFITGLRSKTIHTEFETALGPAVYSLTQATEGFGRFKTAVFSCQDDSRTGPRSFDLVARLPNILKEFAIAPSTLLAGAVDDEQGNYDPGCP